MIRLIEGVKKDSYTSSNIGRDKRDRNFTSTARIRMNFLFLAKFFLTSSEIYAASFPVTNPIISSRLGPL